MEQYQASVMRRSRTQVYQVSTPATVGKFTAVATGAAQAGCQSNDIGKFTLTTNNSTVKIMYKTEISDVALKFEVAGGGSLGEIKVANTKINEWEELTLIYGQIGKLRVNGYSKNQNFFRL
jgi:hypothetical protein